MKRLLSLFFTITFCVTSLLAMNHGNSIPLGGDSVVSAATLKHLGLPDNPRSIKMCLARLGIYKPNMTAPGCKNLYAELFISLLLKLGSLKPDCLPIQELIQECNKKNIMLFAGDGSLPDIEKERIALLALPLWQEEVEKIFFTPSVDELFIEKLQQLHIDCSARSACSKINLEALVDLVNVLFDEFSAINSKLYDSGRRFRLGSLAESLTKYLRNCNSLVTSEKMLAKDHEEFVAFSSAVLDLYKILGFVPKQKLKIEIPAVAQRQEVSLTSVSSSEMYAWYVAGCIVVLLAMVMVCQANS